MYHVLGKDLIFPDPDLADEEGLLAIGGDLSIDRLVLAYRSGIFPWYNEGEPILWFSPDPRLILLPAHLKVSKSLKHLINAGHYTFKINLNFEQVIGNCALITRKDQDGTWITGEMYHAYNALHQAGHAHSFEVYNQQDQLVGGLYGIRQGKVFFGESMFHHESNCSKLALYYLVQWCKENSIHFIDAQVPTDHMKSMGAQEISREAFLKQLQKALQ